MPPPTSETPTIQPQPCSTLSKEDSLDPSSSSPNIRYSRVIKWLGHNGDATTGKYYPIRYSYDTNIIPFAEASEQYSGLDSGLHIKEEEVQPLWWSEYFQSIHRLRYAFSNLTRHICSFPIGPIEYADF